MRLIKRNNAVTLLSFALKVLLFALIFEFLFGEKNTFGAPKKQTMLRSGFIRFPLFISICLLLMSSSQAQVLYNNGSTITLRSGSVMSVKGNVTNSTSSVLSTNGTLSISGSTLNNGTINASSTGILVFHGNAAQTVSGSAAVYAKNVIVNNAAGITLTTPLNVDGAMTFTNGLLTAANSTAPVIFSTNATLANTPTDSSHIDGYVQKLGNGAFVFPIGNTAKYQPVGINLTANTGGLTARYYATDAGSAPFGNGGSSPTALLFYNAREYWDIAPVGSASGTVTIYYDGYNNSGISNTVDLKVAHRTGGQWLNEGGIATGSLTAGTVISGTITSWSPFTLGSISASSPLPLELITFSAVEEVSGNRLEWYVEMEPLDAYYEIERSVDGKYFTSIGHLSGKGDHSSYKFYDAEPFNGAVYYRLHIADGNKAIYSRIILLQHNKNDPAQFFAYPQPTTGIVYVHGNGLQGTKASIRNAQSHIVKTVRLTASKMIDISDQPVGLYLVRFENGVVLKIAKQ